MITLNPENGSESRTRNYSFDTVTNTFKAAQAVNDFIFKSPVNLTYNGQPKEASLEFKFKPTHENDRTILLKYYKGKYENIKDNIDTIEPLQGAPVNAGTYTVKAEIGESKSYFEHKGLVSSEWTFTIKKASVAPGADFNKTSISVLWSCKKIRDITNPFSADWKWDNDVNPDQEFKLENPLQLPQFTMATIRGITKKNLLLTQSPEVNARTNTPPDVITPLHPVLPADIAEIPTAQTVMKHFPMVIPFPHTVMTMTMALSLQNQLQKLTES